MSSLAPHQNTNQIVGSQIVHTCSVWGMKPNQTNLLRRIRSRYVCHYAWIKAKKDAAVKRRKNVEVFITLEAVQLSGPLTPGGVVAHMTRLDGYQLLPGFSVAFCLKGTSRCFNDSPVRNTSFVLRLGWDAFDYVKHKIELCLFHCSLIQGMCSCCHAWLLRCFSFWDLL